MNLHKEFISMKELWVIKVQGVNHLQDFFKSPAVMAGSLKDSKTRLLSSNFKEFCDRLKF